ncbi:MAG: hypothetical protein LBH92_03520, partial [Bacteroidales bacterium]|nr:hypothetical protein [Bacteroidales bacterium]
MMYTDYKNKACITASQFRELFSNDLYDAGIKRSHFIKHGRGGNGREVYIEVDTMRRTDWKARIIAAFGPL